MEAIILVAGMGTRLKPLTDSMPKCLTEVNGKAILVNALENLESNGIKKTTLVIGYLGNKIKEKIGNQFGQMKIDYVENMIYNKTNTSYSLWLALRELDFDDSVLILEGDVFFEKKLLTSFIDNDSQISTVVQAYNLNLDGSFVSLDENDVVTDWIHKKVRPLDFKIEDKFKTVNIHKFEIDFVRNILMPTLNKHIEDEKGVNPIEYIMQDIVRNKNVKINTFRTGSLKWFEIDDVDELKIAESIFSNKLSLEEIRRLHGGYWKYEILDFHYLVNNHFPTQELYSELKEKLNYLIEHYPSTQRVVAESLSRWKDKPYFNKENLIVVNGSSEVIRALNQIIDKITVPIPTFNEYVELPKEKLNLFLTSEENGFHINVDRLISEVRISGSNFVVINNPNNPVGNIVSREDIIKILETGVNLIVDEAFIDFSMECSVEDLVEKYDNLIIVKTVTKTMGLAGLRLGYLLTTNKEIKKKVKAILPIWNINSIAEHFVDIFPEFESAYWKSIEQTNGEREELFNSLKKMPFLEPYESKSNFIFCKTKGSSKHLAEFLYDKHNIIIRSELNQKELKSDKYIRIAVRNKEDNKKLVNALAEYTDNF